MDFALVRHDAGADEEELHLAALVHAIRRFRQNHGEPVHTEAIPQEWLSADRFYGSTFDRDARRVLLGDTWGGRGRWVPEWSIPMEERRTPDDSWGPFRWADDLDETHIVYVQKSLWRPGFAHGFLHPPPWHHLSIEPSEAQALFLSFDDVVLGRLPEDAQISYYEADPMQPWARYFDNMWACHWAWVVRTDDKHLLVIGAGADYP